ncbi:MAG TPA: YraN family protein [Candidatus Saccharimonadales bacterium]|nr:YraN family protein [Candidatus Saccharimonadales bacterium]
MSATEIGRMAEDAAATYLHEHGFEILQQNWRTRWCEIDIVCSKSSVVYFVECKYRAKNNWGSGFEYITNKKLQQMHFAAQFWVAQHRWEGDYSLSAIELADNPPQVNEFLKEI